MEQSPFQVFKNLYNPQCMHQCILAKPKRKMKNEVSPWLAFPFVFSGIFDFGLRLEKLIDSTILAEENPHFHFKKRRGRLNSETVRDMQRSSHFDPLRKIFVEDTKMEINFIQICSDLKILEKGRQGRCGIDQSDK